MLDSTVNDLEPFLAAFEQEQNKEATMHFAQFFNYEVNCGKELKFSNEFADEQLATIITCWLNKSGLDDLFEERMEALILSDEKLDEETASQLNWAYETLTGRWFQPNL